MWGCETMLLPSRRYDARDREAWDRALDIDRVHCQTAAFKRHVQRARQALYDFASASGDGAYVGVSWGKDSVVVAHLAAWLQREKRRTLPLVWVRVEPIANPDCERVRDAFRDTYPMLPYDEIVVHCRRDADGWHASGTLEEGFRLARERHGTRSISGVRGEESATRKARMMRWGEATDNTCAPIGWWTGDDVFAYLHLNGLPVHPAYACTLGGQLDRRRIRVASLGGKRGDGMGRAEWERRYYSDALSRLEAP